MREGVASLCLFALIASFRFLALNGFPDDHYVHLAGAQQMLHGEWPSRDFVDLGAPLTYGLSAAAQALFGQRYATEAILMAVAFALGAVLTVRAGVALTGSVVLGLVAAIIEVLIFPRTYSYPKMVLYAAAAVAFLWYVNRPSRLRIVLVAALVAIAALVRHDHGVFIGMAAVVAVALSPLPSDRLKGGISVVWLCGAVLVWLLPYLIFLQTADGVIAHLQRGAAFTAVEMPRQRLTLIGIAPRDGWLLALVWLTPVAALATIAWSWRSRADDTWATAQRVVPIVVLALVANGGLIRDRLEVRLPDAIVAPALLLVWLVSRAWRPLPVPFGIIARVAAVAVLLVTFGTAAVMGRFEEHLDRAGFFNGLTRLPDRFGERLKEMDRPWVGRQAPSAVAREMRAFFDYAGRCVARDERLLVPAFLPEIVVLARRPFAGGQVMFLPGALNTAADHARVMQRLQRQRVPIAVIRQPTYMALAQEFPELDVYLRRFTDTAQWSLGDPDVVHVLMDTRLAKGTDVETGWPCFVSGASG